LKIMQVLKTPLILLPWKYDYSHRNLYICSFLVNSMQKKVTLSIDEEVYKNFQEFCGKNDIMLSKRVERLIKKHIDEDGNPKQGGRK